MIGIFLFWLAFSPVQPAPESPTVTPQVHLQHQKENPLFPQKSLPGNSIAEYIRRHLLQKASAGTPESLPLSSHLARFYSTRSFQPVWTKPLMVSELITAIDGAFDDGLDPADYHISQIKEFHSNPPVTPEMQAKYDLFLTDAFFTLASHLHYGKVDPHSLDPDWNINTAVSRSALEYRLHNAIATERIALVLKELRPQYSRYNQLRTWLAKYRAIAKEGGWPALSQGQILKEGVRDNRVIKLRKRLAASGDLAVLKTDTSKVFNRELADAVKRFQKRNGMEPDGVVGPSTVKVMNIPVESRIDQIRINLERCRWFLSDIAPTYIMVNIPDFSLNYVENGRNRWLTKVVVGQPSRKTPVFKAEMQYIIFNPQWVIPPTILDQDALPGIRKSLSYLSRRKLNVIDRNGTLVDPASVKWSQYTGTNFPYRLQQSSGDQGSLGRIKFLLPNKHIVYLHDTPHKELFKKSSRPFSSGCIRVENPLELAGLVLQDSVKWSSELIRAAVDTKKTRTVPLPKRIPVFILYFTSVAEGDDILFFDDVYERDIAVLDALNKPPAAN
jgi:murein L,D-transpeptidase YcbB/YkuD